MPTRKWGTEFLVNTTTAGSQDQATVTALLDGGFMIAWRDNGPADSVIRAQRYDALGTRVGSELVLDSRAGDQTDPVLVTLLNGTGQVMLTAQDFETASDRDIVALVYTPDGKFLQDLSPETSSVSDGVTPAAAALGSNGVVTVWQDRSFQGGDIVMNGFKFDGTAGFSATVNTNAATLGSTQYGPAIAASPNGAKFVVIWGDNGLVNQPDQLRARIFNADGTEARAEFAVSSVAPRTGPDAIFSSVAWLDNNRFVAAWHGFTRDIQTFDIKYAIFNADGTPFTGELLANSAVSNDQSFPKIVALPSGGFVIAWADFSATGGDASTTSVRLQAFDAAGAKTGGEILVNTTTASDQFKVALTALADGRVVVTWTDASQSGGDTSGFAVRAQIVDPRDGVVDGTPGADTLYGHDAVGDIMSGFDGNDTMFGLAGNDVVHGGKGFDVVNGGKGADVVYGGLDADFLSGEAGDDDLYGENGDDTLVGGAGADLLDGGAGSFDTASYSASLTGVTAALDGSLPGTGDAAGDVFVNIEILVGSNAEGGDDILRGNAGANTLVGAAGDDILDGGNGLDELIGGLGNDTFVLGSGTDTVLDTSGNDTITSTISRTLASYTGIENITLVGSANVIAIGDAAANILTGNDGKNELTGLGGADILDGGAGADKMVGGLDDDIYVVDNSGDTVIEANEAGIDTVESSVSFALGSQFIERLTLTGIDDIDGFGNDLANVLTGNDGDNALDGGGGADTLDGGVGLDILTGGTGDDRYVVDNQGDVVNEFAGEGTADRVSARVSYVLGDDADIEILTTASSTGIRKINLTGNTLDQSIVGNAGMNILKGGGGKDVLQGLGGDDTYYVDSVDDVVLEVTNGGTADLVAASVSYTLATKAVVETLRTTSNGGTSAIDLTGNGFAQTIIGNNGANIINGGGGADVLQGLGGDDTYYVDSASDVVIEDAGKGTADIVCTNTSYVLGANAEIELMRRPPTAARRRST
jgi:serralysin